MSEPKPPPRLSAARPPGSDDESAAYMPRIPWRVIGFGTVALAIVVGGFLLKEHQKATELRSQILRVQEQELAEPARRYVEFREKLERLIVDAAQGPAERYIDRRLRLPGLRSGKGLYLRLHADAAKDPEKIAKGALAMDADVIPSCLGLAPASARGLWQKGEFLMPEWAEDQRGERSVMKLRVADEMLARHIRADLPAVLNMLRSDWFLLVIQQGKNRRQEPVDVFLWDLRREQKLLSARVQASGLLLPVRIASKAATGHAALQDGRATQGSANDCSIAAQLKQMAGMPMAEVSEVPVPSEPDAGQAGAAIQAADHEETPATEPAAANAHDRD